MIRVTGEPRRSDDEAQTVRDAENRLRELWQDEWSDLGLAALTMGLALVASFLHPPLALPLFIGALASAVLAGRAFFRRLELCDRLLLDRDAYAIPEICRRAENLASMESRRALAQAVRSRLTPVPGYSRPQRVSAATEELKLLACELDDETLSLDPACAVRCHQLVNNYADSPLPQQPAPRWRRPGLDPADPPRLRARSRLRLSTTRRGRRHVRNSHQTRRLLLQTPSASAASR